MPDSRGYPSSPDSPNRMPNAADGNYDLVLFVLRQAVILLENARR